MKFGWTEGYSRIRDRVPYSEIIDECSAKPTRFVAEFNRPKGHITMALVANIRYWVKPYLGPSVLVIEREAGKTRIALRFQHENVISELEVADLLALKRKSLPAAAIYAELTEACRLA